MNTLKHTLLQLSRSTSRDTLLCIWLFGFVDALIVSTLLFLFL